MSTSTPSPAVTPSPYNLAIFDVHDAIFNARWKLSEIERDLEFFAAVALSCLAHLPAGDEATEDEVTRVQDLKEDVDIVTMSLFQLHEMVGKRASRDFQSAAVAGMNGRDMRIGLHRTSPVRFVEKYLKAASSDDNASQKGEFS